MKYTRVLIALIFLLGSCVNEKESENLDHVYPPYKLIKSFSRKVKPATGLILRAYGINFCLPKDYQYINGIGNFSATYTLSKKKNDEISLEFARNLLVFTTENLLNEINSCREVIPDLDAIPFTSDRINMAINFEDENRIQLGQGVAFVYFSNGKIKYEGYNITEYRNRPPAIGKHYVIHEETYADALEIVKKQGTLKLLD